MFVESGKLTAVKLLHHKKTFRPIVCNWELLAKLMVVKVDRLMAFVILGGVTTFVERVLVRFICAGADMLECPHTA